jgi:hypothetical protein
MLQQRQIAVKGLDNQIEDTEYPAYRKYVITDFHSIVWLFIAVIVTIYRNISNQRYQNSHCIMMITTKLLRSGI